MKRSITRIFVVNPPGLGRKRRRLFTRQFESWPKPPPPITYVGINKNRLDLRNTKHRHLIRDDRNFVARLVLRLRLGKGIEDFGKIYDPMLRQADWVTAVVEIGRVANAMSQVKIWRQCAEVPDGELCMIVEDDALINPTIEFDDVEWPETADLLHLWPGGIGFYEAYSTHYVKVVQKWQRGCCNWTSIGYVITPACARRFLRELVPYIVNRTIDMEILYRGTPNVFAVRTPWVRSLFNTSLVAQPTPFHRLARGAVYQVRHLLPQSFRKRHPYLLGAQKQSRWDMPRLD